MPRDRLPHTHRETARGQTFWYYRRGHGPRTRLRGAWGSAEFMAAYRAADTGEVATRRRTDEGTFGWLWSLYRASPAWERLSPATKKQRDNLMRLALERAGNQPLEVWNRKFVIASCDARAATPAQARNFLGVLRALFQWGLSREHVETDPTIGVKVERLRGDGFHAWTAEELARFEERWPLGTRERLAFDIMLWTGLRRGDAARVGPQHVKDGVITLKTAKTGAPVTIRILPPLAASLAASPAGPESFVTQRLRQADRQGGDSETGSARHAALLAFRARRTGCARRSPPRSRSRARHSRNWTRCSHGRAAEWPVSTRERQVERGSRRRRFPVWVFPSKLNDLRQC